MNEDFVLKVKRHTETAKLPKRSLSKDVGMDLFLDKFSEMPSEDFQGCEWILDEQENKVGVKIYAGGWGKFPTGISCDFNSNYGAFIWDKSSFGYKGIKVFGGCIENTYRGIWYIMLGNTKTFETLEKISDRIYNPDSYKEPTESFFSDPVNVFFHTKIAQICFLPVGRPDIIEVQELDETERVGGFGSTGER